MLSPGVCNIWCANFSVSWHTEITWEMANLDPLYLSDEQMKAAALDQWLHPFLFQSESVQTGHNSFLNMRSTYPTMQEIAIPLYSDKGSVCGTSMSPISKKRLGLQGIPPSWGNVRAHCVYLYMIKYSDIVLCWAAAYTTPPPPSTHTHTQRPPSLLQLYTSSNDFYMRQQNEWL